MNFLAHLYLSGKEEHLIVGNFLGDFIQNKEVGLLPAPVQRGIYLHRQIDSYTDNHPIVKAGAKRLRESHGKYAPVILDVLYDYILAQNWEKYSEKEIGEWAKGIYAVLLKHRRLMHEYLQKRLALMVGDNWLVKYGTEEGLRFTFGKMKLRASKPAQFEKSVESLRKDYVSFEQEFNAFFPDVIEFVKTLDL